MNVQTKEDLTKEKITELYSLGNSQYKIAKMFCCSSGFIATFMKKHGIKARNESGPIKRIHLDIKKITELYNAGVTLKEMGILFKASISTIYNFIIKNNIKKAKK